jgi:hypothetical protein
MRKLALLFAFVCGLFAATQPANAVSISVDLSTQRIQVTSAAGESYTWPISSGRSGFSTPHGTYKPTSLQRMHYSHKYHMSPMPYSIFFRGGYAIHGTYSVAELGRPASHGCIRLAPANAAQLFGMVQKEGARIAISGTPPGGTQFAAHRPKTHHHHTMVASRHHHSHAMAYAPTRHGKSLKQWMAHPGRY